GRQKPMTAKQVEEWMNTINRKRLDLTLHALEPLYNTRRELAIVEMSHLLQEAIEEVRVVSASLREQSQAILDHSSEVRAIPSISKNNSGCTRQRIVSASAPRGRRVGQVEYG